MRVCLEATSVIGPRSGVGHTTAALAEALVEADRTLELVLLPVTFRRARRLSREAPQHDRIETVTPRIPAGLVSRVWSRVNWPPGELFCGKVDVFHGTNFLLPPLLKAAGVMTIHELAFVRMPELCSEHVRSYARTVPKYAARANRIVVPSRAIASEVAQWLPNEAARVRVVHPGVRRIFFEPGGPLTPPLAEGLGVREPYVAFVGNLEARKNLDVLLEAFESVRSRRGGVKLVLAGAPGTGWDAIAERHEKVVGSEDTAVLGYLPDAEIAALVRGAAAFVYPSRYEGFGMPTVEAMATGTPVVASTAPAVAEACGGHATLVDPDDADALADAIERTIDDPPGAEALDEAKRWAASFTWERAARTTLDVYSEALEEVSAA